MSGEEKKSDISKREEEILSFWEENNIFEKTLEKTEGEEEFVFYDGPPFATGLPHYGHVLPGTIKDVIPRYKTMRGYYVKRRWGWDCHGLPLENQVEKELGIENKQGIEEYGIEKFNTKARNFVLRYADDWLKIMPRTGRWVDMDNDYRTMDAPYTESIWWAFNKLFEDKNLYEGFKPMHICPRCETPLSNFEVNQGYTDIKDLSVTAKFKLEDEDVYVLAWTTTPWTFPGNMALAVNPELEYVKVKATGDDEEEAVFILAKETLDDVMEEYEYEILGDIAVKDLVGRSYEPLFDYFTDADIDGKENAWKIYPADFVTTEEGTGVVHIAPAFGSDDLSLAQEHDIPVVHHVAMDGVFTPAVEDFKGMHVKPKDEGDDEAHMQTDIEIIKWLYHHKKLFSKKKITHSYPLCWRCDTPLINYATNSWFVKAGEMKDKLLSENEDVHWVPEAIGSARFGDWLEGARDWAISRLRYWGAPLPVWKSKSGDTVEVISSIEELKSKTKSTNSYVILRHGEAEHNVKGVITNDPNEEYPLTDKGEEHSRKAAKDLGDIDLIITSPVLRTKQTADIIAQELGLSDDKVVVEPRIGEIDPGEYEGIDIGEYVKKMGYRTGNFDHRPDGGESFNDLRRRAGACLYDIDQKYEGKRILFVTHSGTAWMLFSAAHGLDDEMTLKVHEDPQSFINPGEFKEVDFAPLPHDELFRLDLHRPYIDEVTWKNEDGEEMHRIPDVFDCWFESGSMPYASQHYPFNKEGFDPEKGLYYPADFIAEGLDQTRGWFYSLLVLGVGLFGKAPYKNVIANGLILAEDGKKMSKRLGNYPPLEEVLDEYGADALRFFLINSPAVRAGAVNFSKKGIDEVVKKVMLRLLNTYTFLDMYTDGEADVESGESEHILDRWIVARLYGLREEVTTNLDRYELDRAARPFVDFVDDLSTWYLRRSRDRLKDDGVDKEHAKATLRFVLKEIAKLIAPFMPFLAEDLYEKLGGEKESVHLEEWPEYGEEVDTELIELMRRTRHIVSEALDARSQEGMKVRQPLSRLSVSQEKYDLPDSFKEDLIDLIKGEVNVKEVVFSADVEDVELDFELTDELIQEGIARELIRAIQSLRKKEGLDPGDEVVLVIQTDEAGRGVIEAFRDEITSTASLKDVEYKEVDDGKVLELDDVTFEFRIDF
ncbi:MAG: class I tRNA ligase family protein [Candidatus Paceibacterota bacterium]